MNFTPLNSLLNTVGLLLASATVALAADPSPAPDQLPPSPGGLELLMSMMPMFMIVFFIFYFMVIRPQQQKLLAQRDLIKALKRGDGVVTSGGLIGKVSSVEKDHVLLEISSNVKVKVENDHIVKRQDRQAVEKSAA